MVLWSSCSCSLLCAMMYVVVVCSCHLDISSVCLRLYNTVCCVRCFGVLFVLKIFVTFAKSVVKTNVNYKICIKL